MNKISVLIVFFFVFPVLGADIEEINLSDSSYSRLSSLCDTNHFGSCHSLKKKDLEKKCEGKKKEACSALRELKECRGGNMERCSDYARGSQAIWKKASLTPEEKAGILKRSEKIHDQACAANVSRSCNEAGKLKYQRKDVIGARKSLRKACLMELEWTKKQIDDPNVYFIHSMCADLHFVLNPDFLGSRCRDLDSKKRQEQREIEREVFGKSGGSTQ